MNSQLKLTLIPPSPYNEVVEGAEGNYENIRFSPFKPCKTTEKV